MCGLADEYRCRILLTKNAEELARIPLRFGKDVFSENQLFLLQSRRVRIPLQPSFAQVTKEEPHEFSSRLRRISIVVLFSKRH